MIDIAHKVLTNKFNFEQIENIIENLVIYITLKKNEVNKISSLNNCSLIESFNYIFYKYNIHNNILKKNYK